MDNDNLFELFSSNNGDDNAPKEASADIRYAANSLFTAYTAFIEAGFNEVQALQIAIAMVTAGPRE